MDRIIPKEGVIIAPYTTFRVGGPAQFFFETHSVDDVQNAVRFACDNHLPLFFLGGGSNVLVSDDGLPGVLIRIASKGITIHETDDRYVFVDVAGGVVWDEFVSYVAQRGWWGVENLSGIPGTVAGGVVGNIGAYGQEVKDVIESVECYDTITATVRTMTVDACDFGYRTSMFKSVTGRHVIVTSVRFRLFRNAAPQCLYKDIQEYVSRSDTSPHTPQQMRDIVSDIRKKKLPDWRVIPSAGSYFKNPVVDRFVYDTLAASHPTIPAPRSDGSKVKLSAAWLIDKVCHLRGYASGHVATHETQALVIINKGGATAQEIKSFGDMIATRVHDETGITLEREVELLGKFI